MNTRRVIGQRRGGAVAGYNQAPPEAPTEGVAMPINPAGLIDGEVRASLDQMAQAINMKAQAMTDQVNHQNVQRENPPVLTMDDRRRDFRGLSLLFSQGLRLQRTPRSLWMRCIRS